MSLGPIPWTATDQYAKSNGFHGPDYFKLISYIRSMDNVFLDKTNSKQ